LRGPGCYRLLCSTKHCAYCAVAEVFLLQGLCVSFSLFLGEGPARGTPGPVRFLCTLLWCLSRLASSWRGTWVCHLCSWPNHRARSCLLWASISVTPPTPIRFGWFWAGRLPWCIGTPPRPVRAAREDGGGEATEGVNGPGCDQVVTSRTAIIFFV
jgi:hypothetical protein